MRYYTYLGVIVIISFLLSLYHFNLFSLDELGLFLTVIGLIYGLIAAFTINNAWERFSKIRDAVAQESNSLLSMYQYAQHLTDKESIKNLKETIVNYCKSVVEVEWKDYWNDNQTNDLFRKMFDIVAGIKFKGNKDIELFDEVSEELRNASQARTQQLILSRTKISKLQWILNIFLSLILIIGLLLVNIENTSLSIFIVASMIAAVMMIFLVVYELDSMQFVEYEVSVDPYFDIIEEVSGKKATWDSTTRKVIIKEN